MWDNIFYYLFALAGVILSAPVIIMERVAGKQIIKSDDRFDRWSLGHVLAAYIIFNVAMRMHQGLVVSFCVSFGVMYAYELLLDATRIEDAAGFSMLDIGANFWGAVLGILTWII